LDGPEYQRLLEALDKDNPAYFVAALRDNVEWNWLTMTFGKVLLLKQLWRGRLLLSDDVVM